MGEWKLMRCETATFSCNWTCRSSFLGWTRASRFWHSARILESLPGKLAPVNVHGSLGHARGQGKGYAHTQSGAAWQHYSTLASGSRGQAEPSPITVLISMVYTHLLGCHRSVSRPTTFQTTKQKLISFKTLFVVCLLMIALIKLDEGNE